MGCRDGFFEKSSQGLPWARHSHFQPAPTNPLQYTGETVSEAGSTSVNMYLRTGRGEGDKEQEQQREH